MKEIISKERTWLISNPIPNTSTSCNKDLNGGYGTWDKIGNNLISNFIARLKKKNIKVIVVGTFPTKFPEVFKYADYIIIGEPEEFFINWDGSLDAFKSKEK